MQRKIVFGIVLALLLIGMLTLAFNIQPVKAWTGTVYIRADGSIDPPDAPIMTFDNVTYTLTDNITSFGDGIIVERDNIVIDGAGYSLQGPPTRWPLFKGIDLSGRRNVTVTNMKIMSIYYGIYLNSSSNNSIVRNTLTANGKGIWLSGSSNYTSIVGNNITNNLQGIHLRASNHNSIVANNLENEMEGIIFTGDYIGGILLYALNNSVVRNNIKAHTVRGISLISSLNSTIVRNSIIGNNEEGIWLSNSFDNHIVENNITSNGKGIRIMGSSGNTFYGNNIVNNQEGIFLSSPANNNVIYHNNFINNTQQVYIYPIHHPINVWDDGYPSGGNYWSDYEGDDLYRGPNQDEHGRDGIGDTPYTIDENNQDKYPLMHPWGSRQAAIWTRIRNILFTKLQRKP
jgi:parallel beta-helix repeat protein